VATLNLSPSEQEALATALRRGDSGAFEQLYAALHPSIYSFAARLLDDREEAKDVTQEVFLAAYRDLPRHRGALRVEPWLFRVTMNACYDRLRARARRADTPLEEVSTLVDARDGYDQSAMAAAVEAALRDMSPRYRAALILHDVQGLNRRELSEAMNVTWGTAGVLLFRARAAFKKRVSALLPAGSGVAALALLPALPVPSALQAPPLFGAPAAAAPLAAPLAAAPLAATPAALPAAAPLLGIANIGGVLGTKVALVAAGVLAMASGLAIQDVVDQNGVLSPGPGAAALVQSAATQGDGGDGKAFHSRWPGEVPEHLQQLRDGSTGESAPANPGSTSGAAGTTARVNDGTATAGTDSSTTSTQQSGAVEPSAEPSGATSGDSSPTSGDSSPTGTDTKTTSDVKTGSSTDPAVRPK
jgi:RNA polymerase sigma-70 factor (ECF subfamily)